MFKLINKFKKKLELAEAKSDANFIEHYYGGFLNQDENAERAKLKEIAVRLNKLAEISQTSKMKDKLEEAQKEFDQQNKFVNNIVKWQTQHDKIKTLIKELEEYIQVM